MEVLADDPWGGVEDEDAEACASPLLLGTLRRDGSTSRDSFCTNTHLLHKSRYKGALRLQTGPTFRAMDASRLENSSSSETRMSVVRGEERTPRNTEEHEEHGGT